jgi:hypothetical protein
VDAVDDVVGVFDDALAAMRKAGATLVDLDAAGSSSAARRRIPRPAVRLR